MVVFLPLDIVERSGSGNIPKVGGANVDFLSGVEFKFIRLLVLRPSFEGMDLSSRVSGSRKTGSWSSLANRRLVSSMGSSDSTDGFLTVPKSKFFSDDSK